MLANTAKPLNLTANGDIKVYGHVKTYGPGRTAFTTGAGEFEDSTRRDPQRFPVRPRRKP